MPYFYTSEEDFEPQEDHSAESDDSDRGSDGEGSEDGGNDGEGSEVEGSEEEDGESDGEQAAYGGSKGDKEEGEGNREVDDVDTNPNVGWAEAMAKILQKKTPESKPSILLKNKQLDKMKEKEKKEYLERKKQTDKKRAWEMMCREKPDFIKDRENERNLQRVSTRYIHTCLFNAVRKHQKTVDEKVKEAGGSERKKAKLLSSVSKKDFINVLRGTEGGSMVVTKTERQTVKEKPAWSVLRDDFMMGASMKDWDKESDEEGGEQEAPGGAEDYNSESD
uniref:RRP15-like protein n=1 Tax=Hucho hucho TaxID=62062 RepID=A0A4W5JDM0_9TELE